MLGDNGAIALVQSSPQQLVALPERSCGGGRNGRAGCPSRNTGRNRLTDLELLDELGTYERPRIQKDGSYGARPLEIKVVKMFLFAAPMHAVLAPSMEITAAQWFPFRDITAVVGNPIEQRWFASVFDRVREAIQRD